MRSMPHTEAYCHIISLTSVPCCHLLGRSHHCPGFIATESLGQAHVSHAAQGVVCGSLRRRGTSERYRCPGTRPGRHQLAGIPFPSVVQPFWPPLASLQSINNLPVCTGHPNRNFPLPGTPPVILATVEDTGDHSLGKILVPTFQAHANPQYVLTACSEFSS